VPAEGERRTGVSEGNAPLAGLRRVCRTPAHTRRSTHVLRMSSVQQFGLSRRRLSSCVFRHSRETSRMAAESRSVHCSSSTAAISANITPPTPAVPSLSISRPPFWQNIARELSRCAVFHPRSDGGRSGASARARLLLASSPPTPQGHRRDIGIRMGFELRDLWPARRLHVHATLRSRRRRRVHAQYRARHSCGSLGFGESTGATASPLASATH